MLNEFDGFLAGTIVCPDMIAPSHWMACIWGEEGPEFDCEHQAQTIIDLNMGHYNGIIRQLDQDYSKRCNNGENIKRRAS